MPRVRKHTGWYVIAKINGGTANQRTNYLCGPFASLTAASKMLLAVSYAARRHSDDPLIKIASIHTGKITRPIDQPLPRGSLDLVTAVDETWIMYMCTNGMGDKNNA